VARLPRLQIAGGVFHLTARGNRRQPIYVNDRDRDWFLKLLTDVVSRNGWRCHAFCLMPNHYHLLVETPEPNLSLGMYRLNGSYAQWFNRTHTVEGHLFQRRFHSVLVESNWDVLQLSRYIVLNPVRAGLCSHPAEWRWSSYRATVGLGRRPALLTLDWLLSQFGRGANARLSYREFIDSAPAHAPSP
jgi:REP-associated tyrosine transposase